jgi:SlyX protein
MPDERVKLLEERVAWLEHHVTQQDKAMLDQAKRLDRLAAEIIRLRERDQSPSAASGPPNPADDRPPHY